MTTVAVVWEPSVEPDPKDPAQRLRSVGQVIHDDFVLVWREYGDDIPGGWIDHVTTDGIWAHVTDAQITSALGHITERREPDEHR